METEKKEKKKKPKTSEILKLLSLYFAIIAVVTFLVFVVLSIIRTFPDYVPISNADNLLQIWITVNGVLMGFGGIIFAQLISSTMDQQNVLYQHILEETGKDHKAELRKILNYLDLRRILLSLITVFTLSSLAYSILLSMQGIAKNSLLIPTDVYAVNGFMSGPLFYSVLGITFLIIALILPLKPPLEDSSN